MQFKLPAFALLVRHLLGHFVTEVFLAFKNSRISTK